LCASQARWRRNEPRDERRTFRKKGDPYYEKPEETQRHTDGIFLLRAVFEPGGGGIGATSEHLLNRKCGRTLPWFDFIAGPSCSPFCGQEDYAFNIVQCGRNSAAQIPGTPRGTYTVTITGTSGMTTNTVKVKLVVK